MSVKGYKGFDKDLQCRGMQYEVGKTYSMEEPPSVCNRGFHFCERIIDVHEYYKLGVSRICEIEATGEVAKEGNKSATNKIKIIRELSREDILTLANTGTDNSGNRNSGNRNSGDGNSGNRNSGNRNSGDGNSGDGNSGNRNSGDGNSGDGNSGDGNSGNRNSGEFNSCDHSAGVFMTKRISYEAFNKSLTEDEFEALIASPGYQICQNFRMVKFRIRTKTGKFGDFRYMSYKSSWRVFWNNLRLDQRMAIRQMPHFDRDIFFEITGIRA